MGENRLINDFYDLTVEQLMDKRIWDLPLIEENADILDVLSILGGRSHIWVVDNKKDMKLVGVITEHDVLSILAPKHLPSFVFGMPDLRSIQHGTAKMVSDIMCSKIIVCNMNDKIEDALLKMVKYRLRRLAVISDEKLVGQLTLHQLIRKYYAATQYHPLVDEDKDPECHI